MAVEHPHRIWQEHGRWCVQTPTGQALIFNTRDEAIAYTTSTFADGPSSARADTQHGEVSEKPAAQRSDRRPPPRP